MNRRCGKYETGRGSFKIRAKYRYDKKNSCIEVYEIPYTTTTEAIIEAVASIIKTGKMKDITDIRDETDLEGLKITIDIKKNSDPDDIMNKLFKLTPLQDSFGCNFNILIGRSLWFGCTEILDIGFSLEWSASEENRSLILKRRVKPSTC